MRLPPFVRSISPVGETLEAMEQGVSLLTEEAEKRNRQLSPSTADEGLSLWERDYGLPDGTGRDTAFRLARIRAAMAGSRTMTRAELESLAVRLAGADRGEAEEDFAHWNVTLTAVYENRLPADTAALEEALRRLRPAHLEISAATLTALPVNKKRYLALTGGVYLELRSRDA